METSWNPNLIVILEKIRLNSVSMSDKHRARSVELNSMSKSFDLPVIVCSVFSSSFQSLGTVPAQAKSTYSGQYFDVHRRSNKH